MKKFYSLFFVVFIFYATNGFAQFNSISLDGTGDYVNIPYNSVLNPTSFTIEAWFKTTNTGATQVIMSSLGSGQGGYTIFTHGGQVLFQSANSGSINDFYSGYTVTTNWTHVACTYDESTNTRKIFINGVEEASSTSAVYGLNSSGPLRIGCHATELNYFFSGKIDEVKIWNTAHNASEIQEFMNIEVAGTETGLVAYYQMSDGTGTSLTDNSSNSNTGTLVGNTAWVNDDNGPKGVLPTGDGSTTPYQIESLANLYWLTQNTAEWDMDFEQTADIDASITSGWDGGEGFWPIGINLDPDFFTGSYNGQGHRIDGLFINRSRNSIGFIGSAKGAAISNIGLTNVNFTSPINSYVGGLVGICTNNTSFSNCYVTGTVSGKYHVGGFIGNFFDCYITNCYSLVNVTRNSGTSVDFGALIGRNGGTVENCYSTGSVYYTGVSDPTDKGFVGINETGTFTNNFFDSEASNQTTGAGATAKTTAEMQTLSTYTGWDFNGIWIIDAGYNSGYPFLSVLGLPIGVTTQAVTDITGGSATGNGNITALGYPAPTAHGVCWNTTGTPTIADSKTDNGAPASTGAFTAALTGLELSTTYYARAYVTNVNETIYGNEVSFTTTFASSVPMGGGTSDNPYRIATLSNLLWISEQSGLGTSFAGKYFIQTADIDASATSSWNSNEGWIPIGDNTTNFSGNYNGMGFIIDGLFINRPTTNYIGLFGKTLFATLQNIGMTNVNVTGALYVGGLCGRNVTISLSNCFSSGTISGTSNCGGLAGRIVEGNVSNSYSISTVTGSGGYSGVLVGFAYVGINSLTISNCYAAGVATGSASTTGGFIGYINNVNVTVTNSFWNSTLQSVGFGTTSVVSSATGKSTTEMTTGAQTLPNFYTVAGWDFAGETTNGAEDIWDIDGTTNNGYPFFYKSLPTVTTQAVGDITTTTATGNGNVTDIGNPAVFNRGVCWNTTGSPTIADSKTNNNVAYATGAFTTSMTGLAAGTTYYVRAYATTISGTAYGEEVSFTTLFESNTWDGSEGTAWNTGDNWSSGLAPSSSDNITIPGSLGNYPLIASGVGADCNDLSVASGASLTVESGGSLITTGTISNEGTINIKRTISDEQWHLISSPISDATAAIFEGNYLQSWSEANAAWTDVTDLSTPLTPGQGFGFWGVAFKGDYTFSGTPNSGEQNIAITISGAGGEYNKANLVGNPYPSSIDWNLVSGYGANYIYNGTAYVAYPETGSFGTGYRYIPPSQGFFIVAESAGNFTLTNACRTNTGANTFYKSQGEKSISNGMVLQASNGSYNDELYIVLDDASHEDFELQRDAYKFLSGTEGLSQIYSYAGEDMLSIDVRPACNIIPLGFKNDQSGIYSIKLKEISDIPDALLEDTKLNIFHDLVTSAYEFAWDVTDDAKRFKLHLNAVGIEETQISESDILIYSLGQEIFIKGAEHGNILVLDIMGRIVLETKILETGLISIPVNLQTGVYVVRVQSGEEVRTEKVFIN